MKPEEALPHQCRRLFTNNSSENVFCANEKDKRRRQKRYNVVLNQASGHQTTSLARKNIKHYKRLP